MKVKGKRGFKNEEQRKAVMAALRHGRSVRSMQGAMHGPFRRAGKGARGSRDLINRTISRSIESSGLIDKIWGAIQEGAIDIASYLGVDPSLDALNHIAGEMTKQLRQKIRR